LYNRYYSSHCWTCCLCTEGQLVHTLPEGEAVCGVTSFAGKVYLLRDKDRDQVEVYDINTYHLLRSLTVAYTGQFMPTDMTLCEHYHCVYIGDLTGNCVHRLDVGLQGAVTRWDVNDYPHSLSVNAAHNVLVTCPFVHIIKEFSLHGDLLRKLKLFDTVIYPWHAIQTGSGQFIVCHGGRDDPVNRVCMMSDDGSHIVHSHGGQPGSDAGQYRCPHHLAVDDNQFVLVADLNNRRVTLLSPTLEYVRQVVSRDQLKDQPRRLYLDTQHRLLYVAVLRELIGSNAKGHVAVFSV